MNKVNAWTMPSRPSRRLLIHSVCEPSRPEFFCRSLTAQEHSSPEPFPALSCNLWRLRPTHHLSSARLAVSTHCSWLEGVMPLVSGPRRPKRLHTPEMAWHSLNCAIREFGPAARHLGSTFQKKLRSVAVSHSESFLGPLIKVHHHPL